ncbi:hypothetical protein NE865_16412 [Phthorimaea operculella]|nr:hypothetical protein NE865_16412 [Phthorimaea operculella]
MVIALTHMRTRNDAKLAEGCDQIDLILGGPDHVYEVQTSRGSRVSEWNTRRSILLYHGEMVIALTHMRTRNDVKLAEGCDQIDLILGGHDHVYEVQTVNGKMIIKSGTDFRQFSRITVQFGAPGTKPKINVEAHDVTSEYAEDPALKAVLDKYSGGQDTHETEQLSRWKKKFGPPIVNQSADRQISMGGPNFFFMFDPCSMGKVVQFYEYLQLLSACNTLYVTPAMVEGKLDEVLGRFSVPLEGRFSEVRRAETNLGNWVCDVALAATNADLVILNSGTFRSDRVHPAGDFTLRDLSAVIPMRDPLVVVGATGAVILAALENAVSKYPSLEGRFPQVSYSYLAALENAVSKYPSLEGRFPQKDGSTGKLISTNVTGVIFLSGCSGECCQQVSQFRRTVPTGKLISTNVTGVIFLSGCSGECCQQVSQFRRTVPTGKLISTNVTGVIFLSGCSGECCQQVSQFRRTVPTGKLISTNVTGVIFLSGCSGECCQQVSQFRRTVPTGKLISTNVTGVILLSGCSGECCQQVSQFRRTVPTGVIFLSGCSGECCQQVSQFRRTVPTGKLISTNVTGVIFLSGCSGECCQQVSQFRRTVPTGKLISTNVTGVILLSGCSGECCQQVSQFRRTVPTGQLISTNVVM